MDAQFSINRSSRSVEFAIPSIMSSHHEDFALESLVENEIQNCYNRDRESI
jgi:hypothetical protein